VAGVDHDGLADQAGAGLPERLGLAQPLRPAADDLAAEPAQRLHGLRAARAVRSQPDLALELGHGPRRAGAVDGVRTAAVEAHLQEPLLQRPDVLTDQRGRHRVVEGAGAELPPGAVERLPGLGADEPVDSDAPALLEGSYGVLGGFVEGLGDRRKQVQAHQDRLDLLHGRSGVSTSDRTHARLPNNWGEEQRTTHGAYPSASGAARHRWGSARESRTAQRPASEWMRGVAEELRALTR
jgi:hypothetical protein